MDNSNNLLKIYLNKIIEKMNIVIDLTNKLINDFGFKPMGDNNKIVTLFKFKLKDLNEKLKYYKEFSVLKGGGNDTCDQTVVKEINNKIDKFIESLKILDGYYMSTEHHGELKQIITELNNNVNNIRQIN
jgi:uncharacterized protein YydD (DUF2326 family)